MNIYNFLIVFGFKEITLKINDLPDEANGLRFALLSDLHAGNCVTRTEIAQVVEVVNAQHVDAVLIAGDAVDGERNETFDRLGPLQFLRSNFGTFYVSGNHEYYYGDAMEWFKQFQEYGIQILDNKNVLINGVCLAGVNDYSSGRSGIKGHTFDPQTALKGCQADRPVVVLSHNPAATPEIIHNAKRMRVDLILS
uniref:Metallophos domain-containing protein n=1 Tax=Syphacia muris TaxID=451379 RepID=A0A0N5AA73_9BILA